VVDVAIGLLSNRAQAFFHHDNSYQVAMVAISDDKRKIIATQNTVIFLFYFN
jgi:hypothetical protein